MRISSMKRSNSKGFVRHFSNFCQIPLASSSENIPSAIVLKNSLNFFVEILSSSPREWDRMILAGEKGTW